MLTTMQHQFAPCLPDPQERRAYATHMCGLCHALGDRYGLLARLATSQELILLNLLTSAQRPDEPVTSRRRCPLNPLRTVATNHDFASEFAAAVAVEMANAKFGDDVQDSGGRDVGAHLGRRLAAKPREAALHVLRDLRFDVETLDRLGERQNRAETDETQDPAAPSALAGAELFSMTARLAASPQNSAPLAAIGANFGAYIYLLDAYHDFARDMASGDYNPLRRFARRSADFLTLSQSGLEWLLSRFKTIQSALGENVPKLRLYRHRALLVKLLCSPVDKIALELSRRLEGHEMTFRRWQWAEALKAGLFILPRAEAGAALTGIGWPSPQALEQMPMLASDPEREQRRGPCQGLGYWCGDCGYYGDGCGNVPCGEGTGNCGQVSSGHAPNCQLGSCEHMDTSGCGHVDLSNCGHADPGSCVDCSHCGNLDLSGCGHMDCSGCGNMDLSGCGNVDLGGCSGVDCGGCGS